VIFRRRADAREEEEEEIEQVLFQGAANGVEVDLKANAKLVQAGLVRAKDLVSEAMSRRAEMIRVEPKGNAAIAMAFVDGVPYPAAKYPAPVALAITQMLKLLAGLDTRERSKPQSGAINAEYTEKKYKLRIDAIPVAKGVERLIVRIEDPKFVLEKPDEIGLKEEMRIKVRDYASEKEGVILAAGPPMSGTSTTAIGLMRSVDAYLYSIFNLADLGDRDLAHVTNFKANEGESLKDRITRAKRQDADVMFVDPLRSAETAQLIFEESKKVAFVSEILAKDAIDAILRLNAWLGNPKKTAESLKACDRPEAYPQAVRRVQTSVSAESQASQPGGASAGNEGALSRASPHGEREGGNRGAGRMPPVRQRGLLRPHGIVRNDRNDRRREAGGRGRGRRRRHQGEGPRGRHADLPEGWPARRGRREDIAGRTAAGVPAEVGEADRFCWSAALRAEQVGVAVRAFQSRRRLRPAVAIAGARRATCIGDRNPPWRASRCRAPAGDAVAPPHGSL
jgi:Tfp pilus assembly pilus retraction ATPase PilT